jgi:ferredoxin
MRAGRQPASAAVRRVRIRRRGFARRRLLRYSHVLEHALTPWLGRGMSPPALKRLREFPSLPAVFRRPYLAPRGAWAPFDPPLEFDAPADYGLEGICDRCQVCVRRCPVGAIPSARREHRGVTKITLNTKRCFPIVAQAAGCAVCMKVCPVQAYGLDEFGRTGRILGKDTRILRATTGSSTAVTTLPGVSHGCLPSSSARPTCRSYRDRRPEMVRR